MRNYQEEMAREIHEIRKDVNRVINHLFPELKPRPSPVATHYYKDKDGIKREHKYIRGARHNCGIPGCPARPVEEK